MNRPYSAAVAKLASARVFVGDAMDEIVAADAREIKRVHEAALAIGRDSSRLATRAEAAELIGALAAAVGAMARAVEDRQRSDAEASARETRPTSFFKKQQAQLATPENQAGARQDMTKAASDAVAAAVGDLRAFVREHGAELDEASARIKQTSSEYGYLKGGQASVAHYGVRMAELKQAADEAARSAERIAYPSAAIAASAADTIARVEASGAGAAAGATAAAKTQ